AVYSECSDFTMCEIQPGDERDVSHAFGIWRNNPTLKLPYTIQLRYNGEDHPIDDIVFLDRNFYKRWLREFKNLEGSETDEKNISEINVNPPLNTPISLVRQEGNNTIEIILYQSQANEKAPSDK
ncbi:MAG: hypothetical protein J6S75_09920, partial [Thermoguttaceae bacterium]|nr:hypothetical protein [Thermoguttaceae bacterium]